MADGRRAAAKPLRRLGHAGVDQQGVEDNDEIGVQFLKVHDLQLSVMNSSMMCTVYAMPGHISASANFGAR